MTEKANSSRISNGFRAGKGQKKTAAVQTAAVFFRFIPWDGSGPQSGARDAWQAEFFP